MLVALAAIASGIAGYGYLGLYPTFLRSELGFSPEAAGSAAAMFGVGAFEDFAVDAGMADFDERGSAGGADGAHEFDGEFIGDVEHFEQDAFAAFDAQRVSNQQVGQFAEARISHNKSG